MNKSNVFFIFLSLLASCSLSSPSTPYTPLQFDDDIVTDPELSRSRYLFLKSELLTKEGKGEEAILALEEVNRAEDGKSSVVLAELAEAYLRAGRMDDSLEAIDKAILIGKDTDRLLRFKAGVLSALGRGKEAIEVYQSLIKRADKSDDEAYLLLSGLYLQTGNTKGALDTLEDLVKNNPNSIPARYYLAKLYSSLRDFDKAEQAFKAVLKLQSSEPIQLEYIKVLALNQKIDAAIVETRKLIKENPESAKARELLGELLLGTQNIEGAIEAFNGAEDFEADPTKIQLRVALLKLQIRDYESAEVALSLLLAEKPENDVVKYYLATAIASQDRIVEALRLLKSIKPKDETYKKARGFGAFLLREENKFKEALKFIDEACSEMPDDVELIGYKIAIYRELNDLDSAFEELEKISKLQPDNDQHLFNLGVLEEERGNKDSSLDYMEKAIEINGSNANALNYLGYSLAEDNKDLDRAEKLIQQAIKLEPKNGYFLDSLGWVYFQKKEFTKAVLFLEKAVVEVPADGLILLHLAESYIKAGNKSSAKKTLKKALKHLELNPKEAENAKKAKSLLDSL